MKICTSHDAIRIMKYQGFFKNLKYFEVLFKVYPLNDLNRPGIYYVVIKDQDQFVDNVFEVNVLKKSIKEMDFEETLDKIREQALPEFKIPTDRKRGTAYGQG